MLKIYLYGLKNLTEAIIDKYLKPGYSINLINLFPCTFNQRASGTPSSFIIDSYDTLSQTNSLKWIACGIYEQYRAMLDEEDIPLLLLSELLYSSHNLLAENSSCWKRIEWWSDMVYKNKPRVTQVLQSLSNIL